MFNSNSNISAIHIKENFSDNDISVLCLPSKSKLMSSEDGESDNEDQNDNDSLTLSLNAYISNAERKSFKEIS